MDRRDFIGAVGLSLLIVPLAAEAQQAGRVYRLGLLHEASPLPTDGRTSTSGIQAALRELGYIEGQNLVIERRYAEGKLDRLPALARELVQLGVDVIVPVGGPAIRAAKAATTTIPIVMFGGSDPVAAGFVTSLARPGGNITGVLTLPGDTLSGKKLERSRRRSRRRDRSPRSRRQSRFGPGVFRRTEKAARRGIKEVRARWRLRQIAAERAARRRREPARDGSESASTQRSSS